MNPPLRDTSGEERQPLYWDNLPRIWIFLGYFLPRSVRERVFRPALEDLYQDYLEDLRTLNCKAQSRGLGFFVTTSVKLLMNVMFPFWSTVLLIQTAYEAFKQRE
jgi:hypothetical protein